MKKRYLRPSIEKALTLITLTMFMLLAMLDDFTVSVASCLFLTIWVGTIALNITILKRWGRGLFFKED